MIRRSDYVKRLRREAADRRMTAALAGPAGAVMAMVCEVCDRTHLCKRRSPLRTCEGCGNNDLIMTAISLCPKCGEFIRKSDMSTHLEDDCGG